MNEKICVGMEIARENLETEQAIQRILDNALKTRPEVPVYYQPFLSCPYVGFTNHLGSIKVDFDKMYPGCNINDGVLTDFYIRCTQDEDIYLNVCGRIKVWYCGELIYAAENACEDWVHLPITVKKNGDNPVRILCQKIENQRWRDKYPSIVLINCFKLRII